ncbi:MAG: patatin-like phospholipase family protein [Acidimicrobiales bacterium]
MFGVPSASYEKGGVATSPAMAQLGLTPGGLPRLSWSGRTIETAVVLGGGGNRGAVQVGMMRALLERGVKPDLFVGTSIGAINGAAFAGAPTLEGVYLAAEAWRRIAESDVFPRARFRGSWRYFDKRESVFSMDALRRVVAGYLRYDLLEDAAVPFLVVTTRLEDGCEEWITEGPVLDAVMASAALPGMYPVIEFGGAHYFDGGVLDNVAVSAALAAGARQIFVLLCGTVGSASPAFSRPYEAMFAAFSLALQSRLRRDLAAVPAGVDVVVVEQPGLMMFDSRDFSRTEEMIESGYLVAREVLDGYSTAPDREFGRTVRRTRWVRRRGRPEEKPPATRQPATDQPAQLAQESPPAASRGETEAEAADDVPPGSIL